MLIRRNKKELALGVCLEVYRHSALEDLHSGKSAIMDEAFYREAYRIVSERILLLLDLKNELAALCTVGLPIPPFAGREEMPEELTFLWGIITGVIMGAEWDEICYIEDSPGDDLAAYLLEGTFKEYCDGKHRFDDSVMKPINKDVLNRCYRIMQEMLPEESPEAAYDHNRNLALILINAAKTLGEQPWVRVK